MNANEWNPLFEDEPDEFEYVGGPACGMTARVHGGLYEPKYRPSMNAMKAPTPPGSPQLYWTPVYYVMDGALMFDGWVPQPQPEPEHDELF